MNYPKALTIGSVLLYVLEIWNFESSDMYVVCWVLEAVIIVQLSFHVMSNIYFRRYESWVFEALRTNQGLTAECARKAMWSLKVYGHKYERGSHMALLAVVFANVTFIVKIAGNPQAFSYARGILLLLFDPQVRTAALVMLRTIKQSKAVFYVLLLFVVFSTLGGLIMLRHSWEDVNISSSSHSNFKWVHNLSMLFDQICSSIVCRNFQDLSVVTFTIIAGV